MKPYSSTFGTVEILGVPFHSLKMRDVLSLVDRWLSSNQKFQMSVPNIHTLMMSRMDPALKESLTSGALTLSDSGPLVWYSRLLGDGLPERIAGPDLCEQLLKLAEDKKYRVFFLGSTTDVLSRIGDHLNSNFPKIGDIGAFSPPMRESFSEQENDEMIRAINQWNPDIVFVGFTAGKHEKWINKNLQRLNCKMAIGVGAAFDFLAGTKKRAPVWMRDTNLEWFYRLCQEPRRLWKRNVVYNVPFIFISFVELMRHKLRRAA